MTELETPEILSREEYLELPPDERGEYLRRMIKKTIEMNPKGISVSDLASNLPFDKRAISKHLEVLEHTREIFTSKIGPTVLYHPNERPVHPGYEDEFEIQDHEYGIYHIKTRLGEFILLQEIKGGKIKGGIKIPKSGLNDYLDRLETLKEEIANAN